MRGFSTSCTRRLTVTKEHNALKEAGFPRPKLDLAGISQNTVEKSHNLLNRNAAAHLPVGIVQRISSLYAQFKSENQRLDKLRYQRGTITESIKKGFASALETKESIRRAGQIKTDISVLREAVRVMEQELTSLAESLPNDTHRECPIGSEENSRLIYQHEGLKGVVPASEERDHVALGSRLGLFDLEAGAQATGSSWAYLLNEGAALEHALISYALAIATKHGYSFTSVPDVVRSHIALRCGFRPREERSMAQQLYQLGTSHPELALSGTAEIALAALYANSVVDLSQYPMKLVAFGRAYRAEAGARGKDTRGLYRLHQFSKTEMFAICKRQDSEQVMEDMLAVQKDIFNGLGFPYRVLDMPTEELGASAFRKYDIEAWMPGRGRWGEISSLSNCTDYQSRRLHIRYKEVDNNEQKQMHSFAHTINGTAAAIPRLIIALFENGIDLSTLKDPKVIIDLPHVLQPYWIFPSTHSSRIQIRWV